MMQIHEIEAIKSLLATPKKITIVPHRNPDGDAMGSTLGLYHTLKQLQHEVIVMAPNEFPDFLAWLPESEKVIIFERSFDTCKSILEKTELLFTLDFNALHRTGDQMENVLKTLTVPSVMIDHHQAPDGYATFTFSDTAYGSTCEMVYDFIHQLGLENLINKTVATCLYTGIVTDSGSFRFPKTTSKTHKCVADLIERGINNSEIHNLLFDNSSYNRLLLLGKALQNLKMLPEYKTTYITLTQDELNEFGHQKGDTEGIVNYGLSIKGIEFTAIFIENKEEGIIKISFRSQGDFDVNQFARNHFNGGGHINAAGGKSFLTLEETVQQFIAILAKEKNNQMKIKNLFLFGAMIFLASCSQQQQAREPISHTSGTFIKESIERNKVLIADEEDLIAEIIKKDSLKSYIASNKGYWYKYETKVEEVTATPKRGDIAFFDYEIKDLKSRIIYTIADTKPQVYYVDKENIMMGLRDGIKLMKKGETVTFLFPSHMAYGYHGDDKKIGTNEPLICTVSLNDIKVDTQAKN